MTPSPRFADATGNPFFSKIAIDLLVRSWVVVSPREEKGEEEQQPPALSLGRDDDDTRRSSARATKP
jgi:hypothetical protein